jgi:YidC/Oxa1 family membrane protein insertase
MQAIQEKHKDDQAKQSEEMMNLLKTQGGWPLKWCLGMLIQMPVFLGLYAVVANIINSNTLQSWMKFSQSFDAMTYSFLHNTVSTYIDPANLNNLFLWFMNVTAINNIPLTIAAAWLMHLNMKIMTRVKPATPTPIIPGQPDMTQMMWFMNIFLVIMMGWFVYTMPASIGLYVVTSTLIGVLILVYQNKALIRLKMRL